MKACNSSSFPFLSLQGSAACIPTRPPNHHRFHLSCPYLGPRARISSLGTTICVYGNARVTLGRIPRNIRQIVSVWRLATTPRHHDLRTLCVELRRLGLVQGQQFVPHEVVSRSEGGGDRGFPVEVLEDECGAPVSAGERWCRHALLVDLGGFY